MKTIRAIKFTHINPAQNPPRVWGLFTEERSGRCEHVADFATSPTFLPTKCRCGKPFSLVCIPCTYGPSVAMEESIFWQGFDSVASEPDLVDLIAPEKFEERLAEGFSLRVHD